MDYRICNVRTYVNACGCARRCTDTVRESVLKLDSGRKIPCRTGESNLPQQRAGPKAYQLSYIPILCLHYSKYHYAMVTIIAFSLITYVYLQLSLAHDCSSVLSTPLWVESSIERTYSCKDVVIIVNMW